MRNAYPPVFFSRDTDAEEWRHPNKPAARVSIMRDGLKAIVLADAAALLGDRVERFQSIVARKELEEWLRQRR